MTLNHFEGQPENPYIDLVNGQKIARLDHVELESGVILHDVPVAYKTWGKLNEAADNCLIICHAFTGSADAEDWWGPLFGPDKAFDTRRFFIFCANSLGSPYGSASACTMNPDCGEPYGPEFPLVTIRDDVQIHKRIVDALGVKQIACVVGGSMGGMLVLEWAFFGLSVVKTVIPIATSAYSSAWCISWGETQRQSIYCDPKYEDGYYSYDDPPVAGLGAARMNALLTYRSRNSFETRFGRQGIKEPAKLPFPDAVQDNRTPSDEHWVAHNEGNSRRVPSRPFRPQSGSSSPVSTSSFEHLTISDASLRLDGRKRADSNALKAATKFSAQTYLRYQAQKFVKRFDANCYINITRKIDSHDVSRGRQQTIQATLATLDQPALVIGIESDGLFTFSEQEEIARCMPNAVLDRVVSSDGHDGFLLEFGQMNGKIVGFQIEHLQSIMSAKIEAIAEVVPMRPSTFGEVDDITEW
ncbi:hypothetical protein MRB53_039792 [Persea americana]|nr:hypothetical protein MRB53_039792 [Persea americana]